MRSFFSYTETKPNPHGKPVTGSPVDHLMRAVTGK